MRQPNAEHVYATFGSVNPEWECRRLEAPSDEKHEMLHPSRRRIAYKIGRRLEKVKLGRREGRISMCAECFQSLDHVSLLNHGIGRDWLG